jgi:hypothetical protein
VHRLVELSSEEEAPPPRSAARMLAVIVPLVGGLIAYWTSASGLHATHELLESFVRLFS